MKMCGIVGYIGKQPAQPILLAGLKRLEYRGYDSAGVVTLTPRAKMTHLRAKGKVEELAKKIDEHPTLDLIGIGHTRWATHGAPSKRNAHPHHVGDIFLVHNGIIENYLDLQAMLREHDYDFKSDTDSEVLAALIDHMLKTASNLREAVRSALDMIVGAYGIVALSTIEPNVLIAARKGSPLIIGIGNHETFIASDAAALIGYTEQVVYLQDGELAECTSNGISIHDLAMGPVNFETEKLEGDLMTIQKNGYAHYLLKEIHDQPETLRATLRGRLQPEASIVQLGGLNMSDDKLRSIRNIIIVGCGTAHYAGLQAQYYLEQLLDDVTVDVEIASELRYRAFNIPEDTVALIVSQSGETADTLACLQELKRRGVYCLGVVNVVGSTIAREVNGGIYLHVGAEVSVASTKAFTSQVTAIVLFGLVLAEVKGIAPQKIVSYVDELDMLPNEIEKVLKDHGADVKKVAKQYMQYENALYIGRDVAYPIALEGALKLKEVSYIHAEGYAAGELKHGPIALVDDRFFEVAVLLDGWLYEKSLSNIKEISARGGHVVVVTNSDKRIDAESLVRIRSSLKIFAPLLCNVVLQLFAYYVSVLHGNDVDQPRNLAKSVTVE